MSTEASPPAFSRPLALSRLQPNEPHDFEEQATERACAELAAQLGLLGLRKMRISGRLSPMGASDWQLKARLGATVTQACILTLAPVVTRLEVDLRRLYMANPPEIANEAELGPEDDIDIERLPAELDLGLLAAEELALALPAYPRADGAELPQEAADPGDPGPEKAPSPFAALAALKGEDKPK